jgi:hypothetical protein
MRIATIYIANDGTRFDTEPEAIAHDALIVEVDGVMAPLGPKVRIPHGQWVRRDAAVARTTQLALLRVAQRYTDHKWLAQTIETIERGEKCHPSWAARIIGECCPGPVYSAWCRLWCIDAEGREWDQPYFVEHPDEGTGEFVPAPEAV